MIPKLHKEKSRNKYSDNLSYNDILQFFLYMKIPVKGRLSLAWETP